MSEYRTYDIPIPRFEVSNPLAPGVAGAPQTKMDYMEEAVVVDVITNEDHELHSRDGYNVGCIQFHPLKGAMFRSKDTLNIAYPVSSEIEEFPLCNEIVHVFKSLNRWYYTRTVNLGNKPTNQAARTLQKELGPRQNPSQRVEENERTRYAPQNITQTTSKLGQYFQDINGVYKLRHWEGDKIIQGRSGQSIRFGTSWDNQVPNSQTHNTKFRGSRQSPNILMMVGPDPEAPRSVDTPYGRIVEDINKDKSSIWMTSNQIIPLNTSTKNALSIHGKSVPDYPSTYEGNQIVINTSQFIVNTKDRKILFHSAAGIHNTTLNDITFDLGRNMVGFVTGDSKFEILGNEKQNVARQKNIYVGLDYETRVRGNTFVITGRETNIQSGTKVSLISPRIYIGSDVDSSEHMVLGDTLAQLLAEFIDAHLNGAPHVQTATGPGYLDAKVITALKTVRGKLSRILSNSNFVSRQNETPEQPGDRIPVHPR